MTAHPSIHPSASVVNSAILEGDVRIAASARILHGAMLSAGDGVVTIGENVIIMEHAVLRATKRFPLTVGDHSLVGPHASLSGATVEPEVFLETGASVFPAARIGRGSEVRINGIDRSRPDVMVRLTERYSRHLGMLHSAASLDTE